MTKHRLKAWPEYFRAVRSGTKPFEYRKDDRGFQLGDELEIAEWDPSTQTFTGHIEIRFVTYIARGAPLIPEGFCVLGITPSRLTKIEYAADALAVDPEAVIREVERRLRERARHDFALQLDGTKKNNRELEHAVLNQRTEIERLQDRVRELEANEPPAPWAATPKHNEQEPP